MRDMFGNTVDPGRELEQRRGDQEYLAKLFPDREKTYAEVQVGSYWVIRTIHGVTGEAIHAVYDPVAYTKYKAYSDVRRRDTI